MIPGSRAWCPDCERYVTAAGGASAVSSLVHFALLLVSCGLWLPVMVLCGLFVRGSHCPICHGTALMREQPPPPARRPDRHRRRIV